MKHWLVLLLLAAAALRLFGLGSLPTAIELEEARDGYRAWELFQSHGHAWSAQAFGFPHASSPLYTLLALPFVALGGLSSWSVRLPAALLGSASLLVVWQLGRRVEAGLERWLLLLVALAPWHLAASRVGVGLHVAPILILVALLCFQRAVERSAWFLALGSFALTLSAEAGTGAAVFALAFAPCAYLLLPRATTNASLGAKLGALVLSPVVLLALWLVTRPLELRALVPWVSVDREGHLIRQLGVLFGGVDNGWASLGLPNAGYAVGLLAPFLVWGALHACDQRAAFLDRAMLAWFACALLVAVLLETNASSACLVWYPSAWLTARGLWLSCRTRLAGRVAGGLVAALGVAGTIHYFALRGEPSPTSTRPGFGPALRRALEVTPPGRAIVVTTHAAGADIQTRFSIHESDTVFERFYFGLNPSELDAQRAAGATFVVHQSELAPFDDPRFNIESFGEHASVRALSDQAASRAAALDPNRLNGHQDVLTLAVNGDVEQPGAGFDVGGQHFQRGFGVHGDSTWETRLDEPVEELRFGIGLTDNATCSDGVAFRIYADGKPVFTSRPLRSGALAFHGISLRGAHLLTFVTRAGRDDRCDHANWLSPTLYSSAP